MKKLMKILEEVNEFSDIFDASIKIYKLFAKGDEFTSFGVGIEFDGKNFIIDIIRVKQKLVDDSKQITKEKIGTIMNTSVTNTSVIKAFKKAVNDFILLEATELHENRKKILKSTGPKGYNYIDQQFGRLKVIEDTGKRRKTKGKIWLCLCTCGELKEATTVDLRTGKVKSCGCLREENNEIAIGRRKNAVLLKNIYSKPYILEELKDVPYKFIENRTLQVFENGRIFRHWEDKLSECNVVTKSEGYKIISFMINGKRKRYYIHKILAQAFIPNPHGKKIVSFKNGNESDINLSNLYWK